MQQLAMVNFHFLQKDGLGGIPKKLRTVVHVSIVVVTSTTVSAFCSLQENNQTIAIAKSRLFLKCTSKHLKEHLPCKCVVRKTNKDFKSWKTLCQDGYVILYSTRRKTPLFTAERLDGLALEEAEKQVRKLQSASLLQT